MELSEILKIAEENNNKEKRAFLFPGQGAQYVGMGKEIYNKYEEAKKIYDKAEKISEMPIRKICFEGPEEDLNKTENTQMAIFITSLAMLEILKNKNIEAKIAAGLSLGEYTALVYAGILDIENGIKLIKKRGYYMANLLPKEQYSMAAIIGIESKKIEEKCKEIAEKTGLFIVPANYNYANQTVISGNDQAIDQAMTELKEIGAKRTIKLKTSGPFHTKKLEKAKEAYEKELEKVKFNMENAEGKIKVIKNIDGTIYKKTDNIRQILASHIINPVRFDKAIELMKSEGIEQYLEIGPGKALTGFMKTVLITGGSRGIGKAVAIKFAEKGNQIIINYVSEKTDTEKLKNELLEAGAKDVLLIKADVSNSEDVKNMVKESIEKFEKIDILVNNAGITKDNLLMRMSEEEFDKVIQINLKGTYLVTKEVTKYMMKKRSGSIVNLASVVGVAGNAGQCNYAASKAGIIGFTKSIAKELASRNIRANAVAPGFIETDMTNVLKEEIKENINSQIPLRRMGSAKEVAELVYFLGEDASSYITGQVINVDGGMI